MTTKKKSSPRDPESKRNSFLEAQRQDLRATELWDRNSPKMDEMFAAFERLRASLDEALTAVDGFVSESRRVSDKLRKEQHVAKANSLAGWADEWSEVTSEEFHVAATGLIDLVRDGLVHGYPVHVLSVAKRLEGRKKAEWGRQCESLRYALFFDGQLSEEQSKGLLSIAGDLIESLIQIDLRAKRLTLEQVVKAANNRSTTTGAGFAAELACMCGALKYQPDQRDVAKRAIAKAMKGAM